MINSISFLSLLFMFSSISQYVAAQDTESQALIRERLFSDSEMSEDPLLAPSPNAATSVYVEEWKKIGSDLSLTDVKRILSDAGWDNTLVQDSVRGDDQFEIFRKTVSPGVQDYLAVPFQGAPVEFSAVKGGSLSAERVSNANWFGTPNLQEMRKQIVDQLVLAIDEICKMPVRPTTIRAEASAAGIITIDVTWEAEDICP